MKRQPLPIDPLLPQVAAALESRASVVLTAPPGSGKTTRVPPALLDAGTAGSGKILLLQPRRVAARLAARRMADERGSALGQEIGYRVRFEDRTSPATRIEVLTEGLLLRRLQADPFLEDAGLVILDELHERSLHVDLALALLAEVQHQARPDLKIVAMSATLEAGPVANFLGGCPVLVGEGRPFPVEIRYLSRPDDRPLEARCAGAIRRALAETTGHVLAFLPGVGEIHRTAEALGEIEGVTVALLHGQLSGDAQTAALDPSARRKVVLATDIAETSVTMEGVGAVVDSGLRRRPVLDPTLGVERLETGPISLDSAEQRAGRAGRTGPGVCYRLWTEGAHLRLPAHEAPEVQRLDLASSALQLWAWGVDPRAFRWFEAPPPSALGRADSLLRLLGALDEGGITAVGREMAGLPLHPRLARVVLAAAGCLRAAAGAAALAAERDPWPEQKGDLLERIAWIDRPPGGDRRALQAVRQARDQILSAAGGAPARESPREVDVVRALLAGFPDRVGKLRAPGSRRYKLAGGSGARLEPDQLESPWLVAVGLTAGSRGSEAVIRLAAAIDPAWLAVKRQRLLRFDPQREAVFHEEATSYGEIGIEIHHVSDPADPAEIAALLSRAAAAEPRRALTWTEDVESFLARLRWLAEADPSLDLPTFEDLRPLLADLSLGRRSFADLRKVDLRAELEGRLTWKQRQALDSLAPERLPVPSGAKVRIQYGAPGEPPVLAARIQQLFGMMQTPRLAGRPVQVHLLAPNSRPAQVTMDLASFWANTYPEVRKDLRGRYPRHAWPEDPREAVPEDRPKRRS